MSMMMPEDRYSDRYTDNRDDGYWGLPDPDRQPAFYDMVATKRALAFVVDFILIVIIAALIVPFTALPTALTRSMLHDCATKRREPETRVLMLVRGTCRNGTVNPPPTPSQVCA